MHRIQGRVVLELISGEKRLMEASREYGIKDSILSRWKQEFLDRAAPNCSGTRRRGQRPDERIAELERMVGRLTMELEMAKKAYSYSTSRSNGSEK